MENLNFVLGILSTVGVFLLGYTSVGMFKVKNQVSNIFSSTDDLYRIVEEKHSIILREHEREQENISNRIDDIYRQMDSRFDKLENKLKK
jgi:hypothetical protein